MLICMKTNTVISYINRLHTKFKTHEAVAKELGISKRYVIYLKKGERIPSEHLRKLIKMVLK
jgi:transcriptional regulator with XRE-family HTH domain